MGSIRRMIAAMSLAVLVEGAPFLLHAGNADVEAGRRIYAEACKACHGLDGKGAGVMKFRPPAADLTSPQVQAKLDSGLYTVIHEGRANTAMGAWKYALSDEEIRDVLSYVRTFRVSQAIP
ncbi:MAG TPA: cytochrome c [Nitrospira sp.]|nr:cytochrome c [Nitrospira sp.]